MTIRESNGLDPDRIKLLQIKVVSRRQGLPLRVVHQGKSKAPADDKCVTFQRCDKICRLGVLGALDSKIISLEFTPNITPCRWSRT